MPHIIIEATPRLAAELDFGELLRAVHRELTRAGHTRCEDLKSRVHITDAALTGEDMSGQFLVARLLTTNPRPACARSAMAQIIHDCLRRVVQQKARPYWWQCCVLTEAFARTDYLKTDSHTLADQVDSESSL